MSKYVSAKNYHDVKRGWYHGKWYDSAWELALIVYHEDHGLELTRNTRKFPYTWRGHTEYYQPDFKDEAGVYLEVKGINDFRAKRKVACFPYPIKVMTYRDMKPYLDYMERKFGRAWRDIDWASM